MRLPIQISAWDELEFQFKPGCHLSPGCNDESEVSKCSYNSASSKNLKCCLYLLFDLSETVVAFKNRADKNKATY
jgi:hypothetical protein